MAINPKYRQLKAFSLAAQTLSFTAAADAMAVTQASFSVLIKELEQDVGTSLFDRTTRRCELTEAGRTFHDALDRPLEQIELLYRQMQEVGSGSRGRLLMAALPSMASTFVPAALARFREAFPNIDVVLTEHKNDDVFTAVKRREVELGFGNRIRHDPELEWLPIFNDRLLLIVPHGHPLDKGRVTWKEMEPYPQIIIGTGAAERAMHVSNFEVEPAFRVEHVATAVAMVRHGLGLTTFPSSMKATLNLEGVVSVPIAGHLATRQLGLTYLKDARVTRAAKFFIEVVRDSRRSALSA